MGVPNASLVPPGMAIMISIDFEALLHGAINEIGIC